MAFITYICVPHHLIQIRAMAAGISVLLNVPNTIYGKLIPRGSVRVENPEHQNDKILLSWRQIHHRVTRKPPTPMANLIGLFNGIGPH